jgi:ABC-2 type transport system permease protein
MQVFSAYFKVVWKRKASLLIYLIVFIGVSMIITGELKQHSGSSFAETKSNVAILNHDGDSELVRGLCDNLTAKADIVTIPDNSEGIQDALFYGNVDYVLVIPEGFADSFLKGDGTVSLQRTAGAQSTSGISSDLLVNRYLNLAELYLANSKNISEHELVQNVSRDLSNSVSVEQQASNDQIGTQNISFYFQFMAYPIISILLLGIPTIMMAFNEKELKKRMLCAPVTPFQMSLRLFSGNLIFSVAVWVVMCGITFMMAGMPKLTTGMLLMCLNALAFTVASLGIAFFAGKLLNSHIAISAVSNVVPLGMSFICGVFVSQELLGKTVLTIASFTPGYWYVKAVNEIGNLSEYSLNAASGIVLDVLIQLGFAAVFFVLALVASKQAKPRVVKEKQAA